MAISEHYIEVDKYRIRVKSLNEEKEKKIVLLHGMSFTADAWDNLGTLSMLGNFDFGIFALDMPGFGKSTGRRLNRHAAADVLKQILDKLDIKKAVLVGPSMGGGIVLAFSIEYQHYVAGLVLVAPAGLNDSIILNNLKKINVPTLLFWGEKDKVFPLKLSSVLTDNLPNIRLVICPKARHPCYLDTPDLFHKQLLDFLNSLTF